MNTYEFKEMLKEASLSKKDFAEKSKVSYGTIGNWNDTDRPVPVWVQSWLENYIKAKDMDKVVEAVKPHIK